MQYKNAEAYQQQPPQQQELQHNAALLLSQAKDIRLTFHSIG
jgi:hypothetical protein